MDWWPIFTGLFASVAVGQLMMLVTIHRENLKLRRLVDEKRLKWLDGMLPANYQDMRKLLTRLTSKVGTMHTRTNGKSKSSHVVMLDEADYHQMLLFADKAAEGGERGGAGPSGTP